jgi:RNA polymerase sigma factor (sigma-70 family)
LPESNTGAATRLTSLYEAHAADAFRYALHLTGRREDAEDVVQFVFLRAYRMLESGTELVNPRAWLIKATKHRSLNLIRDRRETPTAEAELPTGPRYDPDPAEAEALAEVRSTLWALPENQHHAFVLRHWSGLSQDEIADVLGTTAGAVESLLVRARTTLLEDREQRTECTGVRTRLVQALVPTAEHRAHIASCRRCRTAQTRLLRASEFATAFALVPRPSVAHALASAIPGFGGHVAAAATAGGGAAGAGATGGGGAGAGVATASAATKVAVASKIALVTATAVVALGAAHPVRRAVEHAVLGTQGGHAAAAAPPGARSQPEAVAAASEGGTGVPPTTRTSHAQPQSPSKGAKAKGKSVHAGGNGKAKGTATGKTNGPPAAPGTARGKSATAGSNGKATGKPAGAGKPAKTGAAKGKSATAGSNGKAKGKAAAAGSAGNGAAKGHGKS